MIALLSSSVVFLTIFIASATGLPTAQQQPETGTVQYAYYQQSNTVPVHYVRVQPPVDQPLQNQQYSSSPTAGYGQQNGYTTPYGVMPQQQQQQGYGTTMDTSNMPPIVTPAQNRDGYQFQQFASGNLQDPLNPEAIANGRPPILKQVARGAAPGLVFHWTTISMSVLAVTLCLLLTNGGGH